MNIHKIRSFKVRSGCIISRAWVCSPIRHDILSEDFRAGWWRCTVALPRCHCWHCHGFIRCSSTTIWVVLYEIPSGVFKRPYLLYWVEMIGWVSTGKPSPQMLASSGLDQSRLVQHVINLQGISVYLFSGEPPDYLFSIELQSTYDVPYLPHLGAMSYPVWSSYHTVGSKMRYYRASACSVESLPFLHVCSSTSGSITHHQHELSLWVLLAYLPFRIDRFHPSDSYVWTILFPLLSWIARYHSNGAEVHYRK